MKNKTIFIADHIGQFSKSVLNYLNTCGFKVVSVKNKATAFHIYRSVQPSIVLIHEEFPEIDLSRIIKMGETAI